MWWVNWLRELCVDWWSWFRLILSFWSSCVMLVLFLVFVVIFVLVRDMFLFRWRVRMMDWSFWLSLFCIFFWWVSWFDECWYWFF